MAASWCSHVAGLTRLLGRRLRVSHRPTPSPVASSRALLPSHGCFRVEPLSGTPGVPSVAWTRALHTSGVRAGLEEFFDDPKRWGEETVKSGSSWGIRLLRGKSSEDLHKLWYVLLKEYNMLLTLEQEAKRQSVPMPSPERIKKVKHSMDRVDGVVREREKALRLLQTGQELPRPGEWRNNVFGYTTWYNFKEHPIPWFMNRRHRRRRFYTPSFVKPFIRLRIEKHLREKRMKRLRDNRLQKRLLERFPRYAEREAAAKEVAESSGRQ
ncbi:large ribosomal subunit protein uL29m [Lampetra fluviatilis]